MKLSKTQYQDILQALDALKVSHTRLSLVKIKGRIRVQISGVDSHFEFFRRKSISLTEEEHQWRELEHYELTVLGQHHHVPAWTDVVQAFIVWLKDGVKVP